MTAPLRRLVTALLLSALLGALLLAGGCLINPLPTPDPNGGGTGADVAGRGDAGVVPGGSDAWAAPDAGGGGTDAAAAADAAGPGVDVPAGDVGPEDAGDVASDAPGDADPGPPWPDAEAPGPLGDGADAEGDGTDR